MNHTGPKKGANIASLSVALGKRLKANRDRRKVAELDAGIARYYDGSTSQEMEEQQEWGAFASAQMLQNLESDGR